METTEKSLAFLRIEQPRNILRGTRRLNKKKPQEVGDGENVEIDYNRIEQPTISDNKNIEQLGSGNQFKRSLDKPFKKRECFKQYDHKTDEVNDSTPQSDTKRRKRWATTPQTARQSGAGWRSHKINITPTSQSPCVHTTASANTSAQFQTKIEEILPSTLGSAKSHPKKRRTYELDESIIDLTLLKSASKKDPRLSHSVVYVSSSDDETTPSKKNSDSIKTPHDITSIRSNKQKKVGTAKKFVSKIHVPNFAAIHKKVFDKMEDIGQYQMRTAERGRFLLSGKKSSHKKGQNIHKKVRFPLNVVDPAVPDIPLPNTPRPKGIATRFVDMTAQKSPQLLHENPISKLPSVKNKENKGATHIPKLIAQTKPFHSINQIKEKTRTLGERKGLCKEIVQKKIVSEKNNTYQRREHIKGVRSNRRFDLLMKMRAIDRF